MLRDTVEVDGAPCLLGHRDDVVDLDVRVSVTGQKGRARGLAHSAAVVVVDADRVGQLQGALEGCVKKSDRRGLLGLSAIELVDLTRFQRWPCGEQGLRVVVPARVEDRSMAPDDEHVVIENVVGDQVIDPLIRS